MNCVAQVRQLRRFGHNTQKPMHHGSLSVVAEIFPLVVECLRMKNYLVGNQPNTIV